MGKHLKGINKREDVNQITVVVIGDEVEELLEHQM